jgi:SAM-dependent methyltransferase
VDYRWVDCDRNTVGRRYDRIAGYIPLLDRLFFLPRDLRRRAVGCIGLSRGDSVLEIGCGTGNSLPFLREAVGPQGHIYAVDISKGMLRRAGERRNANRWHNVDLTECDAGDYTAPQALAAVAGGIDMTEFLFGSYYICRGTKPLIDADCADHSIAANDDADIDMAHRIAAE